MNKKKYLKNLHRNAPVSIQKKNLQYYCIKLDTVAWAYYLILVGCDRAGAAHHRIGVSRTECRRAVGQEEAMT